MRGEGHYVQVNGRRTHSQENNGAGQRMIHLAGDHSYGEQFSCTGQLDLMSCLSGLQKCHLPWAWIAQGNSDVQLHKSLIPGQEQTSVMG